MPLVRSENSTEANKYEGMLFDLAGPIDYFVEAEGVKSPTYTLKVVDLPYVQRLELELHFPAYTGLAPRKIEDGGDLAVLKGTEVRVKVTPTMTARGGQILLHQNQQERRGTERCRSWPRPTERWPRPSRRTRTGSIGSSSTRRPASACRRRRSTRSMC